MDRFNDIWKNRFNDEEILIGDWNTPDANIWEEIAIEVDSKNKKRIWGWFWLVILLALCGGGFLLTIQENTDTAVHRPRFDAHSNLTTTQVAIDEIGKTEVVSEVVGDHKIDLNKIAGQKIISSKKQILDKKPSSINKMNTRVLADEVQEEIADLQKKIQPKLQDLNDGEKSNFSVDINKEKKYTSKNEKSIETTFFSFSEMLVSSLLTKPVFTGRNLDWVPPRKIEPLIDEKRIKRFNVGFNLGSTFWKHRISDQYTNDLSAFDFNYTDNWGIQANLTFGYRVNDYIDLFTDIQYERIKTNSGHNSTLNYNLANESTTSPVNDYEVSLATPYGLSPASFTFRRSEQIGEDNVGLLVDFNSGHTIQNISFPFGVMIYPIGQKHRLIPMLRIGFGPNYLADISNYIQSVDTHHDAIALDKSDAVFVKPDIEKWHFDYRIGVGLNYKFNKQITINVRCDWTRGLNPIFEQELYKTQIDRYQISFGVKQTIRTY